MAITRFSFPTTIHFGPGARALAGTHLREQGLKRALIVTDKGLAALPLMAELKASLEAAGLAVSVYGGVGYGPQRQALRKGVDVLVACPGRLEDLITTRDVELDEIEIVVIDEADRMADMGFLPAVKRLLDATSKDRQTVLFSATLDATTRIFRESTIAREMLGDTFVDHFAATRDWEYRQWLDGVTDWELKRYFEII